MAIVQDATYHPPEMFRCVTQSCYSQVTQSAFTCSANMPKYLIGLGLLVNELAAGRCVAEIQTIVAEALWCYDMRSLPTAVGHIGYLVKLIFFYINVWKKIIHFLMKKERVVLVLKGLSSFYLFQRNLLQTAYKWTYGRNGNQIVNGMMFLFFESFSLRAFEHSSIVLLSF